MAFYADLAKRTPVASGDYVRAVGWLHPDHPFPHGNPPPEFVDRLKEFCHRCHESQLALDFPASGGFHTCEFCHDVRGGYNFGVPHGDLLYVAPEMIGHYVGKHRYVPPPEFIEAVLRSPLPGTREYSAAVERLREVKEEKL